METQQEYESENNNLEFGGDVEPEIESVEPIEEEGSVEEDKEIKEVPRENATYVDSGNRINQLQREKYQALDELQRIREENERLRQAQADSNYAAVKHYDDSVRLRFEKAKQLKAQALESGDVQAQTEADVELAAAVNEVQALNTWKAQQNLQAEYHNRYAQEQAHRIPNQNALEAQRWVEENDWYNTNSPNYHEGFARVADDYAQKLDAHLYRTGQQHLIHSPAYFNELNNHLRNVYNQSRRDLNMAPSRSGVAPVNKGSMGAEQKQTYKLSSDERDLARRLGVTEQAYLQSKIRDIQKNPNKRSGGMR